MTLEVPLKDLRATGAFARRVAAELTGREALLLEGDLGAGKTTFVRSLARALGIDPSWVSSPSFTLLQRYPPGRRGIGVLHADLYRLSGPGDLDALGFEELWASDDLVAVEWPSLLLQVGLPPGRAVQRLSFRTSADGTRRVLWERCPADASAQDSG